MAEYTYSCNLDIEMKVCTTDPEAEVEVREHGGEWHKTNLKAKDAKKRNKRDLMREEHAKGKAKGLFKKGRK